jgi:hypothetical protein
MASALTVFAIAAFSPSQAQAQQTRYYMRTLVLKATPSAPASPPQAVDATYSWSRGEWSSWSSTCSASATRSRITVCKRSDGAIASDSACTEDAMRAETKSDFSGCTNKIQYNDATLNPNQYCQGSVAVTQNVWCVNRYGTPQDMSVCNADGFSTPPATISLPCSRTDSVTGDAFWSNGVPSGYAYRKEAYAGRLSESEATAKALAQCNASDYLSDVANHGFCYFIGYTWVPKANVTIVEAGPRNSAGQGSVPSYDMTGSVPVTLNRFNTVVHQFTIDDRSMDAFQRKLVQCGQNFQVAGDYVAALRCLR